MRNTNTLPLYVLLGAATAAIVTAALRVVLLHVEETESTAAPAEERPLPAWLNEPARLAPAAAPTPALAPRRVPMAGSVESLSAGLEDAWTPPDGSPLALRALDDARSWRGDERNLRAWLTLVPELREMAAADDLWDAEVAYLWGLCREHLSLRDFALGHQARELTRFQLGEPSRSLEDELQPAREFMRREYGFEPSLWTLINAYSDDVSAQLREHGLRAGELDDPESKWDMARALTDAGAPAFLALTQTLRAKAPKGNAYE